MIPDPPRPLQVLPAVDRLEVVVPSGSVWLRGMGLLGVLLASLLAAWLGVSLLVAGLFAAGVASTAFFLSFGFGAAVLLLGPALAVVAGMQVLLDKQHGVVRADRRGVHFERDVVLWEAIAEVRADGDGVALMMRDGSWHDVATELPPAAAWWLAATLAHLHDRAICEPIDEDGLAALRAHRDEARTGEKDRVSRPILPLVLGGGVERP